MGTLSANKALHPSKTTACKLGLVKLFVIYRKRYFNYFSSLHARNCCSKNGFWEGGRRKALDFKFRTQLFPRVVLSKQEINLGIRNQVPMNAHLDPESGFVLSVAHCGWLKAKIKKKSNRKGNSKEKNRNRK